MLASLQSFLRLGLVRPKGWIGDFIFQLVEFLAVAFGVKDSSVCPAPVSPVPENFGSIPPVPLFSPDCRIAETGTSAVSLLPEGNLSTGQGMGQGMTTTRERGRPARTSPGAALPASSTSIKRERRCCPLCSLDDAVSADRLAACRIALTPGGRQAADPTGRSPWSDRGLSRADAQTRFSYDRYSPNRQCEPAARGS